MMVKVSQLIAKLARLQQIFDDIPVAIEVVISHDDGLYHEFEIEVLHEEEGDVIVFFPTLENNE